MIRLDQPGSDPWPPEKEKVPNPAYQPEHQPAAPKPERVPVRQPVKVPEKATDSPARVFARGFLKRKPTIRGASLRLD